MSMITATTWVPRGFAAPFPQKYAFDEDEFERISELAHLKLTGAKEDLENVRNGVEGGDSSDSDENIVNGENGVSVSKPNGTADDDLKEYDLDNYDSNGGDGDEGEGMGMFGNVKSLAYHNSNAEDPYITLQEDEEENEEREELQILATDNLVLAAKVEDEVAHLEVYVYEDEADNLYVHHDIMLPSIPLCVEWIDLPTGKNKEKAGSRGNFVAVGTFEPDIEIWDLDTIDSLYPNAILGHGGQQSSSKPKEGKKKKKKKASQKANDDYHVDAILSLAANRQHRNLLASSSADKTVKLWDLNTTTCAKSYSFHTDKACSLAWNSRESTILLSGAYDRTVVAADMRAPDAKVPRWSVESDVENVRWDPHDSNFFYVSTESGCIHYHDVRQAPATLEDTKSVWTLQAHDKALTSFDINPIIPGFLATGGADKRVKLWNISPNGPSVVVERNLDVGKVFSAVFAPDPEVGFRLAVAGSEGALQVWDTSTNAAIRRTFANKMASSESQPDIIKERLVGVDEDSSDSEVEGGASPGREGHHDAQDGWESMDEN